MKVRSLHRARVLALLASAGMSAPVAAQDTAPPEAPAPVEAEPDLDAEEEDIVVVGQRDPNAVIGDIPPENTLNSRDIRAYGTATVAELLDAIAPQTASARGRDGGRPVVLLNGKRISGFREIRDLPPEAILRLDILPEEVALKYGYRADSRVVNIILRPRFRSTAARAVAKIPTEGGRSDGEADVTRLMLGENSRTTLNLHAERASALTEAERDIARDPDDPDGRDPRDFRTLIGERRLLRAGGTLNRTMFGDVSSTFDGQLEWSDGRSLLGPSQSRDGRALARDSETLSGHAGVALNGQKDKWRWSLTGNYDLDRSTSETDREDSDLLLTHDRARSVSSTGALDMVANGPLVRLPAGLANITVRVGGDTRDLDSRVRRAGLTSESDLARDRVASSLNVDLPVAKRSGALSALGNLSLNANAEVEHLSDFGTLTTLGAGLYWSPLKPLNLIASWTREEGAPGLQLLGDPVLATAGTRIFDFRTGETVLAEVVTGGNPGLDADRRNVLKLGGTVRPSTKHDIELRADYVRTRIDNPISRFPGPTAAIEAAFPDRFTRDADGNLIRADLRAVNFDSAARDELRWGFNFTKPLASARPSQAMIDQFRRVRQQSGGGPPGGGSPGERPQGDRPSEAGGGEGRRWGGGDGGGRRGGGFGGGRQGGRLQLSAYHTWLLADEVRIAPGLPVLDYLDGEAAEGGSGRSRHRVEVDAGWFNNGFGARLSGDWQSASTVKGGSSGTLDFASLTKVDLNLFANLGERFDLVTKYPWLRGSQLRFGVTNIFDAKQKVRDAAGFVPVNYQPDLLDPQGRTVVISVRKLFLPRFGSGRGSARRP